METNRAPSLKPFEDSDPEESASVNSFRNSSAAEATQVGTAGQHFMVLSLPRYPPRPRPCPWFSWSLQGGGVTRPEADAEAEVPSALSRHPSDFIDSNEGRKVMLTYTDCHDPCCVWDAGPQLTACRNFWGGIKRTPSEHREDRVSQRLDTAGSIEQVRQLFFFLGHTTLLYEHTSWWEALSKLPGFSCRFEHWIVDSFSGQLHEGWRCSGNVATGCQSWGGEPSSPSA